MSRTAVIVLFGFTNSIDPTKSTTDCRIKITGASFSDTISNKVTVQVVYQKNSREYAFKCIARLTNISQQEFIQHTYGVWHTIPVSGIWNLILP